MVKKDKISQEAIQTIKSSLKANEYLYGKYPQLQKSIEEENEVLKKELNKLEVSR